MASTSGLNYDELEQLRAALASNNVNGLAKANMIMSKYSATANLGMGMQYAGTATSNSPFAYSGARAGKTSKVRMSTAPKHNPDAILGNINGLLHQIKAMRG